MQSPVTSTRVATNGAELAAGSELRWDEDHGDEVVFVLDGALEPIVDMVCTARDGAYDEAEVSAAMKKPEITLKVALGLGRGRDRVLTCDLTKEYVAINGDYRS